MIEITPRLIRNTIIIGIAFGFGCALSINIYSDIKHTLFPPSWAKPLTCPEPPKD